MPSLSRRTIREALEIVCAAPGQQAARVAIALSAALLVKRSVKLAHARVAKKKATKRDETAAIRQAVFARAGGKCEMLCGREPTDLEHAFGRVRVRQAESNTLALCRPCHVGKTNSAHPEIWLRAYREHFLRYGFTKEARLCEARLDSLELQGRVSPSPKENR